MNDEKSSDQPQTDRSPRDQSLETMFPGVPVQLESGRTVQVKPITFMQFPTCAGHINAIVSAGMAAEVISEDGELNLSRLGELISIVGEPLFQLIVECSDLQYDELSGLAIEDGIELAGAVIRVNWRPSLVKKIEKITQEVASQIGSTSLPV